MDTTGLITSLLPAVKNWRRHLHQNPELEFDLHDTAAFVEKKLRSFGCDEIVTGIGKTGIVATISGRRGNSRRSVGLRADMDALPILEITNLSYRSTIPGRMHACGHDGHTSVLLGAAKYLAETRDFDGTVVLVFQPAEEGGAGGAKAMIDDGLFERFSIDEIYALHNWPGVPIGCYAIRPGPILAAYDTFEITVEGIGGHSSTPNKAVDTIVVLAHIVTALQTIVSRNVDPRSAVVISVCSIHAGNAKNIIPQSGTISGSVRTMASEDRDLCQRRMRLVVEAVAAGFGATAELTYINLVPATVNDPECTLHLIKAASAVVGPDQVNMNVAAQMNSEDFAFITQQRPSGFILVGNGDSAELHNPAYDYDDSGAKFGIELWARLVEERLRAAF